MAELLDLGVKMIDLRKHRKKKEYSTLNLKIDKQLNDNLLQFKSRFEISVSDIVRLVLIDFFNKANKLEDNMSFLELLKEMR